MPDGPLGQRVKTPETEDGEPATVGREAPWVLFGTFSRYPRKKRTIHDR
jgi:hypothetical protein